MSDTASAASTSHRRLLTGVTSIEDKRLLFVDARLAETRAYERLRANPHDLNARLLLSAAMRARGDAKSAKATVEPLACELPHLVSLQFELGLAHAALGEHQAAFDTLSKAADLSAERPDIWYALVDEWAVVRGADDRLGGDAELLRIQDDIREGRLESAEASLGERVRNNPKDSAALKLAADALLLLARQAGAEGVLVRCLDVDPDFRLARFRYATELFARTQYRRALPLIEQLIASDPAEVLFRLMRGVALYKSGQYEGALSALEALLAELPKHPGLRLTYAATLRALRRTEETTTAMLEAIEMLPAFGAGYRDLATVKSFRFGRSHVDALKRQLSRPDLPPFNRAQLHFALGRALEDQREFEGSFENYRIFNSLLDVKIPYDPQERTKFIARSKAFFTAELFQKHAGRGSQSGAPIFIVGMPRAGSTLVEQILSSHSQVYGTGELLHMNSVATLLDDGKTVDGGIVRRYPEVLGEMDPDLFESLGEQYLGLAQQTELPRFTDKLPGNYVHLGLIQLILPHAKIVDVRRHPLDCGFSCFKTLFPQGQPFSHSLENIGRCYSEYVDLMAHYDSVLPGKVHRVIYERLVENPEDEVRRLLDYLGLPFEESCLRFHEQERVVITMSSEQVRMPLYKTGKDYWRNYEPWLGPLKKALGPVLDSYPEAPRVYGRIKGTMTARLEMT